MAGAYQLQKELFQDDPGGELFQGGRAQDDPEEIFDHIDGKPTVERAPLEGRSRDAGSTDAKEKDVTIFKWPKNLSGRNTIYYTICKMYM